MVLNPYVTVPAVINMTEYYGKDLIMSSKSTIAFLAGASFDESVVREDIRQTCESAKANGVNLELILKDVSTVNGDPSRITKWSETVMREVSKF